MLGDLVTFKDCQNDEAPSIVKIWQINAAGYALVSIDGDDTLDEMSIDDEIVGIPLAPEILEKNFPSPEVVCWYPNTNSYRILIGEDEAVVALNTNYVHELQHALRLCGIEKEIEL